PSGSGSIVSGSYITRATLPTPSITPLRNRSRSRESLMAAPLACPPPSGKRLSRELSSSSSLRSRNIFTRVYVKIVPFRNQPRLIISLQPGTDSAGIQFREVHATALGKTRARRRLRRQRGADFGGRVRPSMEGGPG